MEWILKAESLEKKYGDVTAVDNISFEIYRGEIFGFLGPNGAGKTTTIKMMSGLLKPDKGNVTINARDKKKSTGICPQHIVIWEKLSCLEQISFLGRMYNLPAYEIKARGKEILEALGLDGVKDRLAGNLSGGMQRRLNIALALIHSPEIVFLDEPQAGLDPQSRIMVREYIRSIKSHTTVVLTTHDMEEAEKLSDRICIIDRGKILVLGTSDELTRNNGYEDLVEIEFECGIEKDLLPFLDKERIPVVLLSDKKLILNSKEPVQLIEKILKTVSDQNLKISSLQMRKRSLEDIFINLTGRSLRE